MSLTDPTKKMSKSDPNPNSRILITDNEETIHRKFRAALTDSQEGISYDPENRPGVSNLLDILRHVRNEEVPIQELAAEFKNSSLRSLKESVAGAVAKALEKVRENYRQLCSKGSPVQSEMNSSLFMAKLAAGRTMQAVKEAIGLFPRSDRSRPFHTSFNPRKENKLRWTAVRKGS